MIRMRATTVVLLAFTFFSSGCDTGLEPLNAPSGFSGVIRFTNWPPADSVIRLRLVAFENFPSDSSNIIGMLFSGQAVIYPAFGQPELPYLADSVEYTFTNQGNPLQVREYAYIVIAQQYGPNFFVQWQPAGVYTVKPGTFDPAPVRILLHRIVPGININVDFHNLPPKPWR
jgi:hypothetical protein